MKMINVSGTVGESITDGPGFRFTLFVQGCPHHCEGCHNAHTWDFTEKTLMTPEEIFEKISKNPILDGVTLSGGEPFSQAEALIPLAKMIKGAGLELAAYSGYTFERLISGEVPFAAELLSYCDVLVDGPFVLKERSLELKFKGSHNQRILNVKESLAAGKAVLMEGNRWNKD